MSSKFRILVALSLIVLIALAGCAPVATPSARLRTDAGPGRTAAARPADR